MNDIRFQSIVPHLRKKSSKFGKTHTLTLETLKQLCSVCGGTAKALPAKLSFIPAVYSKRVCGAACASGESIGINFLSYNLARFIGENSLCNYSDVSNLEEGNKVSIKRNVGY